MGHNETQFHFGKGCSECEKENANKMKKVWNEHKSTTAAFDWTS